ncbi:hypothetical protein D3C85_989900 [compost metagenome]
MPSGFQYPVYFFDNRIFIRYQVEYTVAHNHIGNVSAHWHLLNVALPELDVMVAQFFCIYPCLFDHRRRKVDTNNLSAFAGFVSGNKTVITCTTAQVYYHIASLDFGKLGWESASKAKIGLRIIAFYLGVIISHDVVNLC